MAKKEVIDFIEGCKKLRKKRTVKSKENKNNTFFQDYSLDNNLELEKNKVNYSTSKVNMSINQETFKYLENVQLNLQKQVLPNFNNFTTESLPYKND